MIFRWYRYFCTLHKHEGLVDCVVISSCGNNIYICTECLQKLIDSKREAKVNLSFEEQRKRIAEKKKNAG